MATALTTVTTQPIRQDLIHYGNNIAANENDDVRRSSEGFFGRLVSWERDASNSCCPSAVKAWILFFVDKAFAFLDWTGIGHWICSGGLQETKRIYTLGQTTPERNRIPLEQNRISRDQVIDALGGPDALRDVPVVLLPDGDLQQDLVVSDDCFPQGHWKIQGEDPAGRKFVALRVQLTEVQIMFRDGTLDTQNGDIDTTHIITIHQCHRETARNGNMWRVDFHFNYPGRGRLNEFEIFSEINEPNLPHEPNPLMDALRAGNPREPRGISLRNNFRELQEAGSTRIHRSQPADLNGGILPWKIFTFERAPKP